MSPALDPEYVRAHAEEVSETEIQAVVRQQDEIERKFIGRGPFGHFVEEILLGLGLVRDFATGRYKKVPYWVIGALVFMYLYLLNPVDVIPDYILGIGQVDDLIVVTVCLMMVRQDIAHYKDWRDSQPNADDD